MKLHFIEYASSAGGDLIDIFSTQSLVNLSYKYPNVTSR